MINIIKCDPNYKAKYLIVGKPKEGRQKLRVFRTMKLIRLIFEASWK